MRNFFSSVLSMSMLLASVGAIRPHRVIERIAQGSSSGTGAVRAGAMRVESTLPIGAPLAGYNHGGRQAPHFPIPDPKKYTTFMSPSVGVLDPNYARALVLDDGNGGSVALVSLDGIGANGAIVDIAWAKAAAVGFTLPRDAVTLHASHSHSGPGAIAADFLWSIAPATDLMVPELQEFIAQRIADALVGAEKSMTDAKIGFAQDELVGVTKNRRGKMSPFLNSTTIDPLYTVIRVDDASTGAPIATVHNFAIHGVCQGPSNMKFSSDIMGGANKIIESKVGGVALFINADAGDIDPADGMCDKPAGSANDYVGSEKMAGKVISIRESITTSSTAKLTYASDLVPFGETNLNLTFARMANCTKGGFVDICTICRILDCDANIHLFSSWVETTFRFTAMRFDIGGKKWALATLPGEPLLQMGWWARNATRELGFDRMILAGYSNNHCGYIATPREYEIGGYESELTFWGEDESRNMLQAMVNVLKKLI